MDFNGPSLKWKLNQKIVDTPLVQVVYASKGIEVFVTAKDGSVVELEPFQPSMEGIVNAIHLAAEIMAGKFYVSKVISVPQKKVELDYNPQQGVKIRA